MNRCRLATDALDALRQCICFRAKSQNETLKVDEAVQLWSESRNCFMSRDMLCSFMELSQVLQCELIEQRRMQMNEYLLRRNEVNDPQLVQSLCEQLDFNDLERRLW